MGLFCIFTLFRCFPANRRANHRGRPVLLLPVYAGCGQADACFSRAFFFPSPVFFPFSPQRHFLVPFLFPVSQAERGLWNEGHGRNAAVLFSHERNGEQRGAEARVPYDVEVTFLRRDTQGRPMAAPTVGTLCVIWQKSPITCPCRRGQRPRQCSLSHGSESGNAGARRPAPPTWWRLRFRDGVRKGGQWPPLRGYAVRYQRERPTAYPCRRGHWPRQRAQSHPPKNGYVGDAGRRVPYGGLGA